MNGASRVMRGALGYPAPRRGVTRTITRGRLLDWIRVAHLWLGLWGAMLGLLFGLTGFLMNHRALLRIPVERAGISRAQVAIPAAFANPDEFTTWLRGRFALPKARAVLRNESSASVRFRGQELMQPERWLATLATPKFSVSARHVPGSGVIDLETQDASGWGLLMRLHTGSGASVVWVLIVDTVAGALILLVLSGVLLWTRLRTPRLAGAAILLTAPVLTAVYLATV
jgi:uncharacterized protein